MNIRSLALDTVRQIRKKQNWFTKKSRIDAINAFDDFLKTHPSEEAIITAAKLALQGAKLGGYGRSGEEGSSFLRLMNTFIVQAENVYKTHCEQAAAAKAAEERRVRQNQITARLAAVQEQKAEKAIQKEQNELQRKENIRQRLENNVSRLVEKYYANTHFGRAWRKHVFDIKNGIEIPASPTLLLQKDLVPEVRHALYSYAQFLNSSPQYLSNLRKLSILSAMESDARNLVAQHELERREVRNTALNKYLPEEAKADLDYYEQVQSQVRQSMRLR